ncbi:OLC1v1020248C1 [Oldenlandia corymbosa var. corymbosa]|uniref:OLC1v1020248C1 n=1 Tax=Oldenlandia corymbosa var. corymbosa TaxID=529605 RepID=A0AAV1EGE3_OLDCO|nr:OLC1v1020248C1 [Oldenlandia corymbosa var. corymbosa]
MRAKLSGWKANRVCDAFSFVEEGTTWVIDNGKLVRFWEDVWLEGKNKLSSYAVRSIPDGDRELTVLEYILDDGTWDIAKFNHLLPRDLVANIRSMPPPLEALGPDQPRWLFEKTDSNNNRSQLVRASNFNTAVNISVNLFGKGGAFAGRKRVAVDMDPRIQHLLSRVRELKLHLEETTDQPEQMVSEAASRSDGTLDLDREVQLLLERQKQKLETNIRKKLVEMETDLHEGKAKVERRRAALHVLEVENSTLKQDMVAAEAQIAGTAAASEELFRRQKEHLMKLKSLETQKSILVETLAAEKGKFDHWKKKVERAEEQQHQRQARLNFVVEKELDEILLKVTHLRGMREGIETAGNVEMDQIKVKAEKEIKDKEEIKLLKNKIAARRLQIYFAKAAELQGGAEAAFLPRERECIMCLSEETFIVFLPCAHQLLCSACNDLHERHECKNCPSCNTGIQQRMRVRYARA